jgi:hypothetical protein
VGIMDGGRTEGRLAVGRLMGGMDIPVGIVDGGRTEDRLAEGNGVHAPSSEGGMDIPTGFMDGRTSSEGGRVDIPVGIMDGGAKVIPAGSSTGTGPSS